MDDRVKSPAEQPTKTRWTIERRLEFVDFRLFWEGRVNRGDLIDFFGISVPQASADLSRYQEAAPGNIVYDKSAKTYAATPDFKPVFTKPSAEGYLAQLRLMSSGVLPEDQVTVLQPPPFSIVPTLRRRLEPETLRRVLEAIRNRVSLEVRYQSVSRPEAIWRWVSPHALGFDGFRWHVRAWCHTRNEFRDFVIARILKVRGSKPSDSDPQTDRGWHREVTLKIAPHPELSDGPRQAIELDYGMTNGFVEIRTRVCLSSYVERALGLDLDPSQVSPDRQQIVLVNRSEVEAARENILCESSPRR